MNELTEKIKAIRAELGLTQKEMALSASTNQSDISIMEKGGKKFIPVKYLAFLRASGFNLSAMLDDSISVDQFIGMRGKSATGTPTSHRNLRKNPASITLAGFFISSGVALGAFFPEYVKERASPPLSILCPFFCVLWRCLFARHPSHHGA